MRFEMAEQTRDAVDEYLRAAGKKPGEFLFPGRASDSRCMTTRQYARLVSEWVASIRLTLGLYGTHSLRRTKATLIPPHGKLACRPIAIGTHEDREHSAILGIEVDDALTIAEQVDV